MTSSGFQSWTFVQKNYLHIYSSQVEVVQVQLLMGPQLGRYVDSELMLSELGLSFSCFSKTILRLF